MQTVREITIKKQVLNAPLRPGECYRFRGGESVRTADECQSAGEILDQIEDAKAAGVRVLLVTIDECEGGQHGGSDKIYEALRRFGDGFHRFVVAHVTGYAASAAAHFTLGANYLLMAPDARIYVHSAANEVADPDESERQIAAINARLKAVALERTAIPPDAMDDALSRRYDPVTDKFRVISLPPEHAIPLRWADGTATLEEARSFAARLAAGVGIATPRTLLLMQRQAQAHEAQCTISGGKIETGTLLAASIAGGELKTVNYAEDGSGNPTAGAKLDHTGTALKCAPANLQIGKTVIRDTWFGKSTLITFRNAGINSGGGFFFDAVHGVPTTTISSSGGNGTSSSRLYIRLNGFGTAGYSAAYLVGCPPTSAGYVLRDSGFRTSGGDLYLDLDLGAWRLIDGVLSYADVAWATASYPATLRFTIVACITDANGSNF